MNVYKFSNKHPSGEQMLFKRAETDAVHMIRHWQYTRDGAASWISNKLSLENPESTTYPRIMTHLENEGIIR